MKSEKQLQDYIKKELTSLGALVYKFASPNRAGVPDLIIITAHGDVAFLECKSPTGKGRLSPLQKHEIGLLKSHCMHVEVVATKEEADNFIRLVKQDSLICL